MNAALPIQVTLEEKRFLLETGFVLRDGERFAPALVVFEALLEIAEEKHVPLVGIGSVRFAQGDFDGAIEAYEEAITCAPDNALAHAHLGEALAFGRHFEEAGLALDKAIQLDPAGRDGGNMAKTVRRLLESGLLA
ncbi:MAG: tetratricopeptide repeat protein [Candidatus Eisenbacteria bacterium]|uniref:Tetratricopeptide repeat protein n=1 Tax=Eiseniibacteriota bacterium TaxID=2212470 RepID=A0A956NC14_UNCEI|nr:tetratricopeptide repeat protein [Candidatus Eisenbacteria bacterium]MCB9463930.1 tetratricopeptide repeat protein [Candidatus Eisenbacteria bacterium]